MRNGIGSISYFGFKISSLSSDDDDDEAAVDTRRWGILLLPLLVVILLVVDGDEDEHCFTGLNPSLKGAMIAVISNVRSRMEGKCIVFFLFLGFFPIHVLVFFIYRSSTDEIGIVDDG